MTAPTTTQAGEIIPRNDAGKPTTYQGQVADAFEKMMPAIRMAVPKHVTPERLVRVAMGALRRTPALMKCNIQSFIGSVMQCAVLGLEPENGLGHAYLIPYGKECTLIVGYRGMVDLARRSGQVSTVYARCVYEGDEFDFSYGLVPKLEHKPGKCDPTNVGKITHAYAVCCLRDGGVQYEVMTRAEVDAIRDRSRASKNGPWVTDYAEMAKKTAIRRLFKLMPVSVEIQRAIALGDEEESGRRQRMDSTIEDALVGEPDADGNGESQAWKDWNSPDEEPQA